MDFPEDTTPVRKIAVEGPKQRYVRPELRRKLQFVLTVVGMTHAFLLALFLCYGFDPEASVNALLRGAIEYVTIGFIWVYAAEQIGG